MPNCVNEIEWKDIKEFDGFDGLNSISLELLLEWEKLYLKENLFQRIFSSLVDVQNNDWQHSRLIPGRDNYKHYNFRLSTWRKRKDYDIEVMNKYANK